MSIRFHSLLVAALVAAAPAAFAADYTQAAGSTLAFEGQYQGEPFTGSFPGFGTALRFDPGLDAATDKSDAAKRAAGHPLHPDVNGLHRGGKESGYIFLVVEGCWRQAGGKDSGR